VTPSRKSLASCPLSLFPSEEDLVYHANHLLQSLILLFSVMACFFFPGSNFWIQLSKNWMCYFLVSIFMWYSSSKFWNITIIFSHQIYYLIFKISLNYTYLQKYMDRSLFGTSDFTISNHVSL
jgi:hypothetical protein